MDEIKTVDFKDIDFDSLDNQYMSLSYDPAGYEILCWQKKVGERNNEILFKSKLPNFLHKAIYKHIDDNYRCVMTLSDY